MASIETITWIDPDGIEQQLTSQGWMKVVGWRGFDMSDFDYVESEIPFDYGTYLKRVKTPPRDMDIDVIIQGSSRADLFQKIRSLSKLFNSYRGIGKLKILAPDNTERYIHCVYKQGLEGQTGVDNVFFHWRKMTLVFRAFDPFFYGAETTEIFQLDQNPPLWFPFFPLSLAGDAVVSQISIDYDGDIEANPTWTIHGPGDNPKMTNLTTGEVLTINNVSLESDQTITIDTRNRKIILDDTYNLLPSLALGSTFWALQRGQNTVKIEMANATASSSIQLAYSPKYLGV
jgi:hypothetical protein